MPQSASAVKYKPRIWILMTWLDAWIRLLREVRNEALWASMSAPLQFIEMHGAATDAILLPLRVLHLREVKGRSHMMFDTVSRYSLPGTVIVARCIFPRVPTVDMGSERQNRSARRSWFVLAFFDQDAYLLGHWRLEFNERCGPERVLLISANLDVDL